MNKREFVWGILIGVILLVVVIFFSYQKFSSSLFRITFCDVGQGDAAFLQTPRGRDILIDGGPSEAVLTCLRNHLPFWDRKIDMVIVSHPQADHIGGLIPVLKHYVVTTIIMGTEADKSQEYQVFKQLIAEEKVPVIYPFAGKKIDYGDGVKAEIIWPDKKWLDDHLLGDKNVMGASTFAGDLNQASTMIRFSYGSFALLFTGDGDEAVQDDILKIKEIHQVDVLKVPHHGSKRALLDSFLEKVHPKMAVISVGAKNRFGHPAKEALAKLREMGFRYMRTDTDGEIYIISDGSRWIVKE